MQIPVLNENQKRQLRVQIEAELYRRSLYEFFVAASHILYPQVDWTYPPFYKYICDLLQEAVERNIKGEEKKSDYIFNLPFRAGKSILLSQIFPVWCWIKQPSMAIMQISHSETLAIKHSHASKMLIESEWFKSLFPDITIRNDTSAKANYMLQSGGKRISFGVQSGILGEGANIQIIDDINSPSDSQAVSQSINETYANTIYSRLNQPLVDFRIILQQRVGNDICQYLLDSNPNKYFHVCLPVKISPNISPVEAIELYSEGLLWKERFSEKVIQDFLSALGTRNFNQQMMQTVTSEEGNIFKRKWIKSITSSEWLKLTDNEKNIQWNLYIDTAFTAKAKDNDASAAILACTFNNNVYVKKAWKWWLEFPEIVQKLKEIKIAYGVRMMYIEAKASGLSIKQQLQRDGFDVADLTPKDKDKISRANAVAPKVEGGHLYFIEDTWNEMLLQEITTFPFAPHDDLTDVTVYGIDNLLNKSNFNYSLL